MSTQKQLPVHTPLGSPRRDVPSATIPDKDADVNAGFNAVELPKDSSKLERTTLIHETNMSNIDELPADGGAGNTGRAQGR